MCRSYYLQLSLTQVLVRDIPILPLVVPSLPKGSAVELEVSSSWDRCPFTFFYRKTNSLSFCDCSGIGRLCTDMMYYKSLFLVSRHDQKISSNVEKMTGVLPVFVVSGKQP